MKTILKLLLSASIALFCFSAHTQGTWVQKADFGGIARGEAVGFSIGAKGYIGMGTTSPDGAQKDFWEFDPTSNTWTQKADFGGDVLGSAVGFSIGNKGYIGTGGIYLANITNNFWEFDPATNAWTRKADFPSARRESSVGLSIGNRGYIGLGLGEFPSRYKKDFWEYDPATNKWTQKTDFPGTGRFLAAGFSIADKGYIGTGVDSINFTSDWYAFDPLTNMWTEQSIIGPSLAFRGAIGFSIGNKGYIGGGFVGPVLSKAFFEYNPATNQWSQKADIGGNGRYTPAGFSIGAKGYIGTGTGGSTRADFWEYTRTCTTPVSNNIIIAPSITSFCKLGSADSIKGSIPAGGAGNYSYAWVTSLDDTHYTTISNATTQNLLPDTVTQTTFYKRVVNSGDCSDTSNKITINITNPGSITISIATPGSICNETSVTFTATVVNPGSSAVYQWKKNGINVGTNSLSYTTNNLVSNDIISCTLTNTVPCPTTVVSNKISITPGGAFAYIPLMSNGTGIIDIVNTATDAIVGSIPLTDSITGVAASKDGSRVYMTRASSPGNIYVINTQTNTIIDTIITANIPLRVTISPDGSKLYVAHYKSVSIINTASGSLINSVKFGFNPSAINISPDGNKVYVKGYDSLIAINTVTNTVSRITGVGSGYSAGICFTPDRTKAYLTNADNQSVSVIDVSTNTVSGTIMVGNSPSGICITPDGSRLYVLNSMSNTVSVINTADNNVVTSIPFNYYNAGIISIDPSGTKVYIVDNRLMVNVINTLTNTISATITLDDYDYIDARGNFIANVSPCATCANNYWLGAVSNAWENAANWTCGTVPGPTTNVIINNGTVVLNSNVTVNTLYVNPGVHFTINQGFNLNILH